MDSRKISENFSSLTGHVKDYVDLRINYVKLVLTEKIARLASFFLLSVIFFILGMFLMLFLSFAFVFWFGDAVGPMWAGALIVTGLYLLAGFIIYLMRHKIFINPLVSHLTKILMEDDHEEE